MGLFDPNQRNSNDEAAIAADDARNLSAVARMRSVDYFGLAVQVPTVRDPEYFGREADNAFIRAVDGDDHLPDLYEEADNLQRQFSFSIVRKRPDSKGPDIEKLNQLHQISCYIKARVDDLNQDLRITLHGRRLEEARKIAHYSFVTLFSKEKIDDEFDSFDEPIESQSIEDYDDTSVASAIQAAAGDFEEEATYHEGTEEPDSDGANEPRVFVPGYAPEHPIHTSGYWRRLAGELGVTALRRHANVQLAGE